MGKKEEEEVNSLKGKNNFDFILCQRLTQTLWEQKCTRTLLQNKNFWLKLKKDPVDSATLLCAISRLINTNYYTECTFIVSRFPSNTRFHVLAVSAVEQLQVMASKRQYKEAAAQLEVFFLTILLEFLISKLAKFDVILNMLSFWVFCFPQS